MSMNTSWVSPLVNTPVMRVRVVWGFWVTMATFSPTRRLRRLLLPTLGLPTRATKADRLPAGVVCCIIGVSFLSVC